MDGLYSGLVGHNLPKENMVPLRLDGLYFRFGKENIVPLRLDGLYFLLAG